jgi:hypothetical protein
MDKKVVEKSKEFKIKVRELKKSKNVSRYM